MFHITDSKPIKYLFASNIAVCISNRGQHNPGRVTLVHLAMAARSHLLQRVNRELPWSTPVDCC